VTLRVQQYRFDATAIMPIGSATELRLPRHLRWAAKNTMGIARIYGATCQILTYVGNTSTAPPVTEDLRTAIITHALKADQTTVQVLRKDTEYLDRGHPLAPILMDRDLIYYIGIGHETVQIEIVRPDRSDRPRKSEITQIETLRGSLRHPQGVRFAFGDVDFLGLVTEAGLDVWSFDPDVVMPHVDASYVRARSKRVDARARNRQSRLIPMGSPSFAND
jgi:hypothetical protein